MMAYITRYIFGTDKLRPQAFEVRGINGISTGVVHCQDAAMLSQWIKHITNNIIGLTNLQVGCPCVSCGRTNYTIMRFLLPHSARSCSEVLGLYLCKNEASS